MENKTAIIVLNGQEFDEDSFSKIYEDQFIIAVDGGINHLITNFPDIKVNLHIGDMDSCEELDLESINIEKTIKFPSEKDYSDYDLAVEEAHLLGYNNVIVFGAFGGRRDHFISNFETSVYFAGKARNKKFLNLFSALYRKEDEMDPEELNEAIPCCFSPITLIGKNENIYFLNSATKFKFKPDTVVSIFSGTDKVLHLTLRGFKYSLTDSEMKRNSPLGLSNIVTEEIQRIEFTKGVLVIVENKISSK